MFKSNNRYRDVIASPEGNTLYVLTDTAGNVQKDDGSVTHTLENPGSLIKFTYNGK
jgi:quinoprotein glucose dehydrogenase